MGVWQGVNAPRPRPSLSQDTAGAASASPGMLQAVIDTVIGNLQLSISSVHIRYEDEHTNPGEARSMCSAAA